MQNVAGVVQINTREVLWITAKRGTDRVNHYFNPLYLQSYLNSYVFRYNHRHDETPLFVTLIFRFPTQK
ncbi:MAG: hypothetical protein JSU58_06225 [Dehalococcoidales bacterium]|nr:MAG: hypothetical protein JSU58_06225 [Dehalococcoidales bacterium]